MCHIVPCVVSCHSLLHCLCQQWVERYDINMLSVICSACEPVLSRTTLNISNSQGAVPLPFSSPCPPIDIVQGVIIVWRMREDYQNCSVIQCCIVYHNFTQLQAHTYEPFLQLLGTASDLGLVKRVLCVFVFYLPSSSLFILCFWHIFSCFFGVVSASTCYCLETIVSEMIYYVSSGM